MITVKWTITPSLNPVLLFRRGGVLLRCIYARARGGVGVGVGVGWGGVGVGAYEQRDAIVNFQY